MMQFAIIGIGSFGQRMVEELAQLECEILIVDKDREVIEALKDKVARAYIADAISEEIIRKLIPSNIDAAIIDLGGRTEVSILVTNYLKKMGVHTIIAKAETDEHGEILEIVGATHVVFPNREAAKRITPMLGSSLIFNYMPISAGLVMAEVKVPAKLCGMTLIEAHLRRTHGLNVVAIRKDADGEYEFFSPEYRLEPNDVLLVVGAEDNIYNFSGQRAVQRGSSLVKIFKNLLGRGR
ncbi:MAG: TrkA family potassium uptake protein [Spirochaetales bacterium]|nr:TrkA family potassium uptake protein [Spirochaetales bacterium]